MSLPGENKEQVTEMHLYETEEYKEAFQKKKVHGQRFRGLKECILEATKSILLEKRCNKRKTIEEGTMNLQK